MHFSFKPLILSIGVLLTLAPSAFSQAYKSNLASDKEIFLVIEHLTANIQVVTTPSDAGNTLPTTVNHFSHGISQNFNWGGDFDCIPSPEFDFDCNTIYKISFNVIGNSNNLSFQFFYCDGTDNSYSASAHGFYCIDPGQHNANDVIFTYTTSGTWKIELQGVPDPNTGISPSEVSGTYNFGDNWTLPWDSDMWCNGDTTCESGFKDMGYLLAPHWDTSNYEFKASRITLPSGTWTWNNKNLGFASGTVLNIEGTLNASNTHFSASGTAWKGIIFWDGSAGSIDGVTIDNVDVGTGGGVITVNSGNNLVTIQNSNIHNDTGIFGYAVSLSGSSTPDIRNNDIWSSKGSAIYTTGWSAPFITGNKIEVTGSSSNAAVYASSSADPIFMNPGLSIYVGNNEISGTGKSLWAYGSGTLINAGDAFNNAGGNDFCTTGTYIARSEQSAAVYAINDFWPAGTSSGLVEILTGGSASTTPEASGNSSCTGPSKGGSSSLSGMSVALDKDHVILRDAISAKYAGDLVSAMASLSGLLAGNAADDVKSHAFAMLTRIAIESDNENLLTPLSRIKISSFQVRSTQLLSLLHGYYAFKNEVSASIVFASIMDGSQPAETIFEAEMEKFYYSLGTGKQDEAAALFSGLVPTNDDQTSRLASAAHIADAMSFGGGASKSGAAANKGNGNVQDLQLEMEINVFPNPFNPTTVFSFELPQNEFVSLKVYDVLGREVALILDGIQSAGTYNLTFDATGLATGTYIYNFVVAGKRRSGSLVLIR